VQGFGMNSADLTEVLMPGSDVVLAGGIRLLMYKKAAASNSASHHVDHAHKRHFFQEQPRQTQML
jgi:hypothetical protein